jgi:hypothetical protein
MDGTRGVLQVLVEKPSRKMGVGHRVNNPILEKHDVQTLLKRGLGNSRLPLVDDVEKGKTHL